MSTKYALRAGRRLGNIDIPELDTLATDLDAAEARLATAEADIDALQAFDTTLQAAWTPYTPTVTSSAGTLGAHTPTGRHKTIGKTTFIEINIVITSNGTGSGSITATLPNTTASNMVLVGREAQSTGTMLQGFGTAAGTTVTIVTYTNTYPGGAGFTLTLSGVYENT
jgi:hypothetical protein